MSPYEQWLLLTAYGLEPSFQHYGFTMAIDDGHSGDPKRSPFPSPTRIGFPLWFPVDEIPTERPFFSLRAARSLAALPPSYDQPELLDGRR